jgi:hypothetical protein
MLKQIVSASPELKQFVDALELPLSAPQLRHVRQIADGLITVEGDKNLSNLYRHFVDEPCPKSAADTFREAPWQADDIRSPLRAYLVKLAFELAEAAGAPKRAFLSLDDSFTEKDRHSKRLESVDWHFDHARSRPKEPVHSKGTIYVTLRLTVGDISLTVDIQLYLKEKTVRKLNRARRRGQRLPFRTKLTIARQMLKAIAPLLPTGYQVYVVFDSWYASARFIKWCRKRKWHVICRLKSNRNLDRIPVKRHHQRLRHRRYTQVRVRAADDERAATYQVRSLTGRLNQVYEPVRVYISTRHSRDKHPRYYGSTVTTLSPHDALLCWPKCTSVRVFRLKQDGIQWRPLFQLCERKVRHAVVRAGLCQAWVESSRVAVYRTVAEVDETRQSRVGRWSGGGCHAQQIGLDVGECPAAPTGDRAGPTGG